MFDKISVSTYKSKNVTILRQAEFQFLAIRVGKNAAILGKPDVFEINTLNFYISNLGNVEGDVATHYFFLIQEFFEFF